MHNIILASGSPRRRQLLEQAGFTFTVMAADVDETNPVGMPAVDVPACLAQKKAGLIAAQHPESIIIAADTIVVLGNDILGKPVDSDDALQMLRRIAGKKHEVVTGVCIQQGGRTNVFSSVTEVYFRPLTDEQILHYVNEYRPMDKAGSYAIQEWIGLIGIEKINGDYYNVMGLPVHEVYARIQPFQESAH
jgi:septum formation protein